MGLEYFRPESEEQEDTLGADPPNFLKPDIRRFSGNARDFDKPRKEKKEDGFRKFSLDVDFVMPDGIGGLDIGDYRFQN